MGMFCDMSYLRTYLEQTNTKQSVFAAQIGVTQATVSKIADGTLTPSLRVAAAIEEATSGAVKAVSLILETDAPTKPGEAA